MIGKFPYWLVYVLFLTILSSGIAAVAYREFEMAVVFCFWASLALSIHGVMSE